MLKVQLIRNPLLVVLLIPEIHDVHLVELFDRGWPCAVGDFVCCGDDFVVEQSGFFFAAAQLGGARADRSLWCCGLVVWSLVSELLRSEADWEWVRGAMFSGELNRFEGNVNT